MTKQELETYNKAIKEKYKFYKLWQVLAIVFIMTTLLFAVLYFASGEVFKETVNDVEIVNEGDSNDNDVTINN